MYYIVAGLFSLHTTYQSSARFYTLSVPGPGWISIYELWKVEEPRFETGSEGVFPSFKRLDFPDMGGKGVRSFASGYWWICVFACSMFLLRNFCESSDAESAFDKTGISFPSAGNDA